MVLSNFCIFGTLIREISEKGAVLQMITNTSESWKWTVSRG